MYSNCVPRLALKAMKSSPTSPVGRSRSGVVLALDVVGAHAVGLSPPGHEMASSGGRRVARVDLAHVGVVRALQAVRCRSRR